MDNTNAMDGEQLHLKELDGHEVLQAKKLHPSWPRTLLVPRIGLGPHQLVSGLLQNPFLIIPMEIIKVNSFMYHN